ncbi:hypothetical protein LQZ19_02010 [Treponema primitia]|uniref:hypothetical protein n=1 Tax=Treponema primitia TaxID=88058 RepID=UPI00397EC063
MQFFETEDELPDGWYEDCIDEYVAKYYKEQQDREKAGYSEKPDKEWANYKDNLRYQEDIRREQAVWESYGHQRNEQVPRKVIVVKKKLNTNQ